MKKIAIFASLMLFSGFALSGTGWYITFTNLTSGDVTISEDRYEDCWYSYDFDHENFIPKDHDERYYTEIKNSKKCLFDKNRRTVNTVYTNQGDYTFQYKYDSGKCRIIISHVNNHDTPDDVLLEKVCVPSTSTINAEIEMTDSADGKSSKFDVRSFSID